MREKTAHDVIVLGAGLSGLLAAALLSRRGRRVLVLEASAEPGEPSQELVHGRVPFSLGPELFLGFEREGLYDRLFIELGLSLAFLKRNHSFIQKRHIPFQLALPSHRLNFYVNQDDLFDELTREFPSHAHGLLSLQKEVNRWDKVLRPYYHVVRKKSVDGLGNRINQFRDAFGRSVAVYKLRRKKVKTFLMSFDLDDELRKSFELLVMLFERKTSSEATVLDFVLLMGLLQKEVVVIHRGISQLMDQFVGVIEKHGGHVLYQQAIEELIIDNKRICLVRTKQDDIEIKGQCILNVSSLLLSQKDKTRYFMSMYFEVARDAVPSAMLGHVLLSQSIKEPSLLDNFFFLVSGKNGGEDTVARNKQILQVNICLPESHEPSKEELRRLRDSIQAQLTDLMPFSKHSLSFIGHDRRISRLNHLPSPITTAMLSRAKAKRHHGATYYTLPIKNLFVLPDEEHLPVAHLWQARNAMKLTEHLTAKTK